MNTPVVTEVDNNTQEIPSLLVPMASGKLLLPTVSVAEMITYQRPQASSTISKKPVWYLGDISWRHVSVPMVSYEALNGREVAAIRPESQVLVLNSTGVSTQLPFVCIPTQGIPRLSRVAADEISINNDVSVETYGQLAVRLAGEDAVIPDVSKIEQICLGLFED